MKHKIIAILAFFGLVSCQKELGSQLPEPASDISVCASIEGGKVSLTRDGNRLKADWELSDRIIVFDASCNTYGYKVSEINDGVATMQLVAQGQEGCGNTAAAPSEGTTLYAVYFPGHTPSDLQGGAIKVDLSSQNGSAEPLALMLAQTTVEGKDILFEFSNQMSILGMRDPVLAGLLDGSLEGITIAGPEIYCGAEIRVVEGSVQLVPTERGSVRVTLQSPLEVADGRVSEETEIFAALVPFKAASDLYFSANTADRSFLFRHRKSAKLFAASKYYYTTPTFSREDAFGGSFSVSPSKKVFFSGGNLLCDATATPAAWTFEEEQFFIPYYNVAEGIKNVYDPEHVRHFFWSDDYYGASEYYEGTSYPSADEKLDWGATMTTAGWSTLSREEWNYLLSVRGSGDTFYRTEVSIADNSDHYLVIAPDGNTEPIKSSYSILEWRAAEADGFVCLAPVGYRSESNYPDVPCMYYVGNNGFYWTSEACSGLGDRPRARAISFGVSPYGFSLNGQYFRNQGFAVRLVCE